MASNRINTPEIAENILKSGDADLISMARPLLADPHFVRKAAAGKADEINTCIACNQACLDYIFTDRVATCLVNPKACREIEFNDAPPAAKKRIAVVGSGPAGLSFAATAASRGHAVTLYEASDAIGGQLNLARRIPGKGEFNELLRYLRRQLEIHAVKVLLNTSANKESLITGKFDHVVVAAGIVPRKPDVPGIDHPKVLSYLDVIMGKVQVGNRVAIIGTGGIGHDVAELLLGDAVTASAEEFYREWGVDPSISTPGGLTRPGASSARREIVMFQRSTSRPGERLGKSTGWILRNKLKKCGVKSLAGCTYHQIDDRGLHYSIDGERHLMECDSIIICAGQEPARNLATELEKSGLKVDLIGGARQAGELDAQRAIDEGTRLAYSY